MVGINAFMPVKYCLEGRTNGGGFDCIKPDKYDFELGNLWNIDKLHWNRASRATAYQIYRSVSGGSYKKIKTLTGYTSTSYTNGSLSTGKTYKYKVRAYNKYSTRYYYGQFSTAKSVTIYPAPKITSQPLSTKVLAGQSATFKVAASSKGLKYQWYYNGAKISGATSSSYISTAVTASMDQGSFYCVVYNAAGKVTSAKATLTVVSTPVITTQPAGIMVSAGSPAEFVVAVSGHDLTYQWYENDQPIAGATSSTYTVMFPSMAMDGSKYHCVIANGAGSVTTEDAAIDVVEKAQITGQPQGVTVVSGRSATFDVTAIGKYLTYQWYVNGNKIDGAIGSRYTLSEATAGLDQAKYTCVVTNTAGDTVSTEAVLSVVSMPVITTQPAAASVATGGKTTFAVTASGRELSYQWFHDDAAIDGATESTYSVTSVDPARDGSSYYCEVTNGAGTIKSEAAVLTVISIPEITVQPQDNTAVVGSSGRFSVAAKGHYLKYQWYLNGEPISGATSDTCETAAAVPAMDGSNYTCRVTNEAGTVESAAASLFVTVKPVITGEPQAVTANAGGNATFSVTAAGRELTYQWYCNGTRIESATSAKLELSKVTSDLDGGKYTCYVKNAAGETRSAAALLTVISVPEITSQPAAVTVAAGNNATFSVTAAGHDLSYQWYLDGTAIEGATESSYTTAQVTAAMDGGTYTCVISNLAGQVTSDDAVLDVVTKAVISSQPASTSVLAGEPVTFTVTATGKYLSYQWYKNGTAIEGATASFLKVTAAVSEDQNKYRCEITNQAGTATSAEAVLTAVSAPVISVQPQDKTAVAGSTATFSVEAAGHYLTYQWYKDGVKIDGAESSSYTTPAATAEMDNSSYSCTIENEAGQVTTTTASLKIVTAPVITVQPSDYKVWPDKTSGASFRVIATGYDLTYQWYENGKLIPGATSSLYNISIVKSEQYGNKYHCVVSNGAGTVTTSDAAIALQVTEVKSWDITSTVKATLYNTGELKFTGSGEIGTIYPTSYWCESTYINKVKSVSFDSGITTTSMNAWFYGCTGLTSVNSLPAGVTTMKGTFQNCTSLTYVAELPTTLTNINSIFFSCSALKTSPALPSGIVSMSEAFYNCRSLTKAPAIPEQVTDMTSAFVSCISMREAPVLPSNVTGLTYTFQSCTALTEAPVIPVSVIDMTSTFYGCSALKAAPVIPASVYNMTNTFYGCKAMTQAPDIPVSAKTIEGTFSGCLALTGEMLILGNPTLYTGFFNGAATNEGTNLVVNYTTAASASSINNIIATKSTGSNISLGTQFQ
jgi:hypothetical protein